MIKSLLVLSNARLLTRFSYLSSDKKQKRIKFHLDSMKTISSIERNPITLLVQTS